MRIFSKLIAVYLLLASISAANAQLRPMVYPATIVERCADEAYADWTTPERVQAFFVPIASINPVPGGD